MLLITGRSNCRQNSGLSDPWSCSASRPHRSAILRIVSGSSSAKTPTRVRNGGSERAMTRAVSGATYRRPGRQKFSPIASAPAAAAARASSRRLIPQIFTLTIVDNRLRFFPDRPEVVHAHPLQAQVQGLLRLPARRAAPRDDDLLDAPRLGGEPGAALADRFEELVEGAGEPLLHLDVAHGALEVARLQVLHLGPVRVEGVVVDEDRVALDVAGVGRMDPGRSCDRLAYHLGLVS